MSEVKSKINVSLKKAKSTLEKIIKMIDNDKYCIDIIQQNLAVIGLIKSVNLSLLEGHLNNCLKDAIENKEEKRLKEMIGELLAVVKVAQSK